jgi:PAS domain S-box-containing protein
MPAPHDFTALGSALMANRRSAIIYADADGFARFWNAGAEALFGHTAAEALGRRIDLIVPEEYRAIHWAGFNRVIGSAWRGAAEWGPIEGLHKSGARVSLEVFLTPIEESDARVIGVLAIFRAPG